jgi:cytochrome P450
VAASVGRLMGRFVAANASVGDVFADVMLPLPALVSAGSSAFPRVRSEPSNLRRRTWSDGSVRVVRISCSLAAPGLRSSRPAGLLLDRLEVRRQHPTEDLLSSMLDASDGAGEGGRQSSCLSDDEIFANAIFLMTAGHETAANALANSLIALLDHPDQLDKVRDEALLPDAAVDELLGFDGPVQLTARVALADRVHAGELVPRGGSVIVVLGAANRDGQRFEDPHRLILNRADNQPLSFAHGAHYCLGAALAKEELRVVLPQLLRRLPGLHLVETPVYQPTLDFRGPLSLRVAWR